MYDARGIGCMGGIGMRMQHRHESGFAGRRVCETSHAHLVAVHLAGHAFAGVLHDVLHHRILTSVPRQIAFRTQPLSGFIARVQFVHRLLSGGRDALRQDVHRIAFDHAGHHENVAFVEWRAPADWLLYSHDLRLLDSKRAGLVKEDVRYASKILQHVLRLDQDSGFGEASGARDVGNRRGDQQRARGGEHKHLGESQRQSRNRPCDAGDRQRQHGERHGQHIGGLHHGRA